MVTLLYENETVNVPLWVADLAAFRQWAESDEFPEQGRISWLQGKVSIDMTRQQLITHLYVKNEFNMVLGAMAKKQSLGMYFPDGAYFTSETADISCVPDALFIAHESLDSHRAELVEGA